MIGLRHSSRTRRQVGYSLPELLIASTVGLFIVVGALGCMQATWRSQQSAALQFRLHERALYLLGTLEPNIQMAGYFGLATSGQISFADVSGVTTAACGSGALPVSGDAIAVLDSAPVPGCFTQGAGLQQGSQILVLRRASTQTSLPEVGRFQLLSRSIPLPSGLLTARGDLAPAAGTANGELRDLLVQIYYIARRADGGKSDPALRVKTLSRIGNQPALIDTEVMSGVTALGVTRLEGSGDIASAVRLKLTVIADDGSQLPVTRTIVLRNHSRS